MENSRREKRRRWSIEKVGRSANHATILFRCHYIAWKWKTRRRITWATYANNQPVGVLGNNCCLFQLKMRKMNSSGWVMFLGLVIFSMGYVYGWVIPVKIYVYGWVSKLGQKLRFYFSFNLSGFIHVRIAMSFYRQKVNEVDGF